MTEIDRIFEESRQRMNANVDRLHADIRKDMNRVFNRIMAVCAGIVVVCGLVLWLVNK